jgi:hypothetical protein
MNYDTRDVTAVLYRIYAGVLILVAAFVVKE